MVKWVCVSLEKEVMSSLWLIYLFVFLSACGQVYSKRCGPIFTKLVGDTWGMELWDMA